MTRSMVNFSDRGFFNNITRIYGSNTTSLMKSWINTRIRICTSNQQLIFLLRCRSMDILPKHIGNFRSNVLFQSNVVNYRINQISYKFKRSLLKYEIKDINYKLKYLRSKISEIEGMLYNVLPVDFVEAFFEFNKVRISNHNRLMKFKSINKFNNLNKDNSILHSFLNLKNEKWLINISNKKIPDSTFNLLSLGDRFGLPVNLYCKKDRHFSTLEMIKTIEVNNYKLHKSVIDELRSMVANSLHKKIHTRKHINYIDRLISYEFTKCKKFLRDNDDIFVTKADKGQVTVVMNKKDYTDKMTDLLNDQSTYKILKKDPINQLTSKIHHLVKNWLDKDIIDFGTYRSLNCTNGNLPRCYGLPKIHKLGYPLRIIVSTLGSPLYNLSRYLHDILNDSISKPKSHIKDSWSFASTIKNICIQPDEVLISLDVTSLFTNIPSDLVLQSIERRWTQISKNTKLSLPQFLHAIELVLSSTCFVYNGKFYEQIFGCPMGSPLSPILADMVLDDLESDCLSRLNFEVHTFHRYMDDIFTILPINEINAVLEIFNSYHPRLKFTHEIELHGSINFLDITVTRECTRLITNWYRKPTFSGRYINYFSNHPIKYKTNVINNLVDRAILLSDNRFHELNIKIVKNILVNNCFPTRLINRYIKNRLNQLKDRVNNGNIDDEIDRFCINMKDNVVLPYFKGISENISHILNRFGLRTIYSVPNKLDAVIKKGKDQISFNKKTGVVYSLDCNDCGVTYIGQTKRHLETRVKEHRRDIMKHDSSHSVISKHRLAMNHDFNWSTPRILHYEKHTRKREIAEMFYIKKRNVDILNLQTDIDDLSPIYNNVIASI